MTAADDPSDTTTAAPQSTAPEPTSEVVEPWGLGGESPVRSWTPLGTVDAGAIADVDPAGLVHLRGAAWSLDWWIGAEDRWHHPSTDAAVRQRPLGAGPVVETAMRVPGGDIVQRVFGVRGTSGDDDGIGWDDSAVVVEIENLTAVPVALAVVIRPHLLDGGGRVRTLGSDGPVLSVDGRVGAVLSKPVARRVVGEVGTIPARLAVADDADGDGTDEREDGRLEGAYVVPLPHTAVVRVLLPRVPGPGETRPRLGRGASAPAQPGPRWDAPGVEAIEAGWEVHTRDTARVQLPEDLLDTVVASSVRTLSIAAGDGFFEGDGSASAAVRNAELCDALVRVGLREPLGPLARALVASERLGGSLRMSDGSDATVALVHAAAPLLVGNRAEVWAEDLVGPVAKAIHRIGRDKGLDEPSLVRSAVVALGRIAPSLRAVGQPDVADAAAAQAARLRGRPAGPATADRGATHGRDGATFTTGLRLAAALRAGDPGAVAELSTLVRTGAPGTLADHVDDRGVPDGRRGLDPAAVAVRLAAVLDLALAEGTDGPVVLSTWSPTWFGQSVEAHGVRTRWGIASYAVRWHGERPAILWEVEPGEGVDASGPGPVFSAPGLDPEWRGQGWAGEALLARLEPPEGLAPTPIVADHMQSGQRIDDAADEQVADPAGGDAADGAAPEEPKRFPGEGISFS